MADTSHTITIVGADAVADPTIAVDIDLTGGVATTFGDVVDALNVEGVDKHRTIALDIPGLETIADIPMDLTTGPGQALALAAPTDAVGGFLGDQFPDVRPVLYAVWNDGVDETPDLALAFESLGATLDQLHGLWANAGDVEETIELARSVLTLVPELDPGQLAEFDPADLPDAVRDLYDTMVDDPALAFENVASLLGDLDVDEMPGLALIARFLGAAVDIDPDDATRTLKDAIAIGGSLADTAAFLFGELDDLDGDDLSLDGPIDIDTENLPLWLRESAEAIGFEVPKLRLRLEPNDTGVLVAVAKVSGTWTVETGGEKNEVAYEIDLDQAGGDERKLSVSAAVEDFTAPFGWTWLPLDDVSLKVEYEDEDPAEHQFTATFEADLTIVDPAPRLSIEVADDPITTRGIATLDGSIPIAELIELLGGEQDTDETKLAALLGLADVTVEELELSIDATTEQGDDPVFGAFGRLGGVFGDLRVRFVLGVDGSSLAPTYLAGLVVDDPPPDGDAEHCGCITLARILPILEGSLAADLELPAVRFLHTFSDPAGGTFDTTRLGDRARTLISEIDPSISGPDDDNADGSDSNNSDNGIQTLGATTASDGENDASDGVLVATGALQMAVDVPLAGLAPFFDALDIQAPDTLGLRGSLGFSLPDLVNDPTGAEVTSFELEATLAGLAAAPDLADWLKFPTTGEWRFRLAYAAGDDDTPRALAIGVSIGGITFDAIEGLEDLVVGLSATFETVGDDGWKIVLRGELDESWEEPFGIEWLTVDELFVEVTIESGDPDGTAGPEIGAEIGGTLAFGSPPDDIALAISLELSTTRARFSIKLPDDVTVTQVITAFGLGDVAAELPGGLGDVALQAESELAAEVVFVGPGPGESGPAPGVYVDAVMNVSFPLFDPDDPIQFSALAHASLPQSGDPAVVLGMRPTGELRLSQILPIDLPDAQNIVLVSDDASFGVMFASVDGPEADPLDLSESARSWFAPLIVEGGRSADRSLRTGFTVLGAVKMPGDLAEFASELGAQDRVQLFGSLPVEFTDDWSASLGLGLVADPEKLPDFLEEASVSVGLELGPGGVSFGLKGSLVVRSQQGVDAELADLVKGIGVELPVAVEITDDDHVCPRGGALRTMTVRDDDPDTNEDGRQAKFCVDLLEFEVSGSIDVSALEVSGTIKMEFESLNHDGERPRGWSPLGFDAIEISQLTGEMTLGFIVAERAFTIEIGGQGAVSVLGYSVSGGIKGGVAVTPPPPPPPIVRPLFSGFWVALPQGIGTEELMTLYDTLVPNSEVKDQISELLEDHVPEMALRDLFLSVGLENVPSLCINQGVALTAELFMGPGIAPPTAYDVKCGPDGQLTREGAPAGTCLERRGDGCVARVDIELSPTGIRIEGELAGFEVAIPGATTDDPDIPVLRLDDSFFVLRATVDGLVPDLLLDLSGRIQIGPGDPAWADGSVRIKATPFQFDAAGRIHVLGYGALFELSGGLGAKGLQELFAGGIDPGMSLRILLTAPGGFGADPDFGPVAETSVTPLLDSIGEAGEFLDEWFQRFPNLNQIGLANLLIDLPLAADAELDIGLEPSVVISLTFVRDWILPAVIAITGDGPSLDQFLNTSVNFGFGDVSACSVLRGVYRDFYGATPGTGSCTLTEVRSWIRSLTRTAVDGVSHLAGLTDQAIDQIIGFARNGAPFTLECAELNADLSLVGGSSFAAAVSGSVFGEPYSVGVAIDVDDLDPFGDDLLQQVWALLTSGSSPDTECTGIDEALEEFIAAEATPVIGVTVAPRSIDEGDEVTATVEFDRDLDAPRDVEIDWGDPTLVDGFADPTTVITVPAGHRTGTATHVYRDDVPSGRRTATYTIRADDLGDDGGAATTTVTVRNVRSTIVAIDAPDRVDEGEEFDVTVRWTDPGTLDEHTVSIHFGDGSPGVGPDPTLLDEDDWHGGVPTWEATASHTYLDDDPTGTPEDPYLIWLLVTDDDRGARLALQPITVVNVRPSDITVMPLLGDDEVIEEGIPVTYRIEWFDPGVLDTFDVVIDFCHEHPTCDEPPVTLEGVETQFVEVTHVYPDDDPTGTPSDPYTIHVTVTDDDTGVGTGSQDVTVHNVDPVVTLDVETLTTQYSDPIGGDPAGGWDAWEPVIATVEVYDVIPDTLEMSVTFAGGNLVGWLDLVPSDEPCVVDPDSEYHHTCTWSLIQRPDPVSGIFTDIAPGTYDIEFTVVDDDTGQASASLELVVEPEDARVWYVGPTFAATTSARDGSATVELRATIRDITSAVPEDHPDWDPWPGDIRKASMRFDDRESSAELCDTASVDEVFSPFDVFVAERSIGVGSCDWTAALGGKDAEEYTIGTAVGDHFVRDSSEDDTVVTIAKPLDDFITGGGYLVLSDSAGVFAGAPDSHANFGFHVKFNRRMTNLQGGVTLIVRGDDGAVYRIKSNAMDSLGVDEGGRAQFESKANITDVSDRDNPYSIGGNYVLQMILTDRSADGSDDTIGFSLWDEQRHGNGQNATVTRLLLFSSRWDGNQTQQQQLASGNLMVHYR